jgi:hypothetical protein
MINDAGNLLKGNYASSSFVRDSTRIMWEKSDDVGRSSGEVHEKYTAGRVNDLSYHHKRHSSTSSRDEQTTTR